MMPPSSLLSYIVLITLSRTALSIVQKCNSHAQPNQCPQNSFCNIHDYCECQPGFLLDCQTKGYPINSTLQQFQLVSNEPKLFVIYPENDSTIYSFRFNFCQEKIIDGVVYKLGLYSDDGTKSSFDSNDLIGQTDLVQKRQCWAILSPFLRFNKQENGAIQSLILSVNLTDNSIYSTISEKIRGQPTSYKMTLTVNGIAFLDLETLWIILFSMVGLVFLSLAGGIVYCVWWFRTHGRRGNRKNSLKHFQKYMPQILIKKKNLETILKDDRVCPICLFQIQPKEYIRKTICSHHFHKKCLDLWCENNLSCPACRQSFHEQALHEFSDSIYKIQDQDKEEESQQTYEYSQIDESIDLSEIDESNEGRRKKKGKEIKKGLLS